MKKTFYFLLLTNLLSCEQGQETSKVVIKSIEQEQTKNLSENLCNFEEFLSDPKTPKEAKDLYLNKFKLKDEDPLFILSKIESKEDKERTFYFRVVTNSEKIADGAYSEGLGNFGKEYIEEQPQEFAKYFDNSCFTDEDLKSWARIVMGEFQIIEENIESGEKEHLVYGYCRALKEQSKKFPTSQQKTIEKFTTYLTAEWGEMLKNI
jgi:hypothetical protein